MTDFHTRVRRIRHVTAHRVGGDVKQWPRWNEVFGWVAMDVWFPVTQAVSPPGINITILENVNV
jgi:hypothetical protein